jgi:hypothetical protein
MVYVFSPDLPLLNPGTIGTLLILDTLGAHESTHSHSLADTYVSSTPIRVLVPRQKVKPLSMTLVMAGWMCNLELIKNSIMWCGVRSRKISELWNLQAIWPTSNIVTTYEIVSIFYIFNAHPFSARHICYLVVTSWLKDP